MYRYVLVTLVGIKIGTPKDKGALAGLSAEAKRIMLRLLQTPPETHKAALKPVTPQAGVQRRRRD